LKKILNIGGKVLSFILSHKIYSILVAIAIIGGSYYFYHRAYAGAKTTYQTATVQKGILTSSVSGSGNIIVDQSANINPSISGQVKSLSVKVGDSVRKGQFLFYVDNPQMDIDLSKAYASYVQAQQSLDNAKAQQLQTQLDLASQTGDAAVKKAATTLAQANQSAENAYSQVLQAQADYNDLLAKQQADPNSVSASQLAAADQKVESAEAAYDTAEQTVKNAKADYDQAVANSGIVDEIVNYKLTSAQTSVDLAQKNVDTALASYNISKSDAAKRSVTSTIAGVVTSLNIKNGDTIGSSSSQSSSSVSTSSSTSNSSNSSSSSNTPVVIEDLSTVKASVAINEVDMPKVALDQKATLTFDAIADLTLTGKVQKIDKTGTNTQNVITYSMTISFDSVDNRILPQMSVSAEIVTDVKQDVLIVPNSAVKTDSSGGHYVQVMINGVPQTRNVEVGISNDTDTEITSGLSEGDTVVTQTITSTGSSSSSSTPSSTRRGGLGGFGGL